MKLDEETLCACATHGLHPVFGRGLRIGWTPISCDRAWLESSLTMGIRVVVEITGSGDQNAASTAEGLSELEYRRFSLPDSEADCAECAHELRNMFAILDDAGFYIASLQDVRRTDVALALYFFFHRDDEVPLMLGHRKDGQFVCDDIMKSVNAMRPSFSEVSDLVFKNRRERFLAFNRKPDWDWRWKFGKESEMALLPRYNEDERREYIGRWLAVVKKGTECPLRWLWEVKPPKEMTVTLANGVEIDMVWCPPGKFLMGGNRPVTLTHGFWIGKFPLLSWQSGRHWWSKEQTYCIDDGWAPAPCADNLESRPSITLLRLNSLCDEFRFRLPTEAEWEYACVSGKPESDCTQDVGCDLRLFCNFGLPCPELNSMGDVAMCAHDICHAHAYPPNPWGIYGMRGNLFEVTSSTMEARGRSSSDDPEDSSWSEDNLVYKGGDCYALDCSPFAAFGGCDADLFSEIEYSCWSYGHDSVRLVCEQMGALYEKELRQVIEVYKGKRLPNGMPYVTHLLDTASEVKILKEKMVALAHEAKGHRTFDEPYGAENLFADACGFDEEMWKALHVLAMDCRWRIPAINAPNEDELYRDYILKIMINRLACVVKAADLRSNGGVEVSLAMKVDENLPLNPSHKRLIPILEDAARGELWFSSKTPYFNVFSNFYLCKVEVDGVAYPSAEHAYQLQKFIVGSEAYDRLLSCEKGSDVKSLANHLKGEMRSDWTDDVRTDTMRKILAAKFGQHPEFVKLYKEVRHLKLIHESNGDLFWGQRRDGKGENRLGTMIVKILEKLCSGTNR